MKYIFNYKSIGLALFFITFLGLFSCKESELILPEKSEDGVEVLQTRPSLRPDSVKVFPAFYNAVEIVYPIVQPDRAVKSLISYMDNNNQFVEIEVVDFDEIVTIDGLEIRPYTFTVVYVNDKDIKSNAVSFTVTPFDALPNYAFNSLEGFGSLGKVYFTLDNITGKEIEYVVSYKLDGVPTIISKKSAALRDTLIINDLPDTEIPFNVSVKDVNKDYQTSVKEFRIKPGITIEKYVLSNLAIEGGAGAASISWSNESAQPLKFHFKSIQNGVEKTYSYTSADVNGLYLITPLAAGNANIEVQVENLETGVKTAVRIYSNINISKSAKDQILSDIIFTPFSNGLVLIAHMNPTIVNTENKVTYQDVDGSSKIVNIDLPTLGSTATYTLLTNVKGNSSIVFEVTDNMGTLTKNFTYTDSPSLLAPNRFDQAERNQWSASASSFRSGPASLVQHADKTLDGIYSEASSGTVTTTQWVNEWGFSRLDSLGTPSNAFPHFLSFDFNNQRIITAVQTYNVGGSQVENGALNFNIEISDNGKDWTIVKQTKRTVFTRGGNEIFTLDKPVVTRYLRLYYKDSSGSAGNGISSGTIRVAEFFAHGLKI